MTIAALKSIFIGVGGSLILAVFCSTFITLDKIIFIMPIFIAFSGAMTGYRLVEALKTKIMNIPVFSFVLGVGGGALTFIALNFAGSYMSNGVLLNIYDLFIYMAVSGITSYLGAKLAVRYFNL
ncbi:MAG: hypothetical protein HOG03_17720 [Desulfobacula sp.]|jgi:hypothetical protein|uniref:hypothetical protein n=1 Tax=Desulfobacula sp. TaxID=2593537 RepID=UPI001DC36AAE|nr:hypothetical protein [Desulfobacula sp.]MBT3486510.1 hypothetical protein [Desulfobacula sp.]MBT3806418.1 hypothetical protein [Desulfobacula sp.]MBT4023914.1 hypothetical protein [Desulfobacula sp.]MBT4198960.1 hypothetical protein [Desulfobacula sp.]